MMDIIIKSQDGTFISRVNSVAVGDDVSACKVFGLCVDGNLVEMGEYGSKKRAIEIVDNIFENLKAQRVVTCGGVLYEPSLIYKMPNR